VDKLEVLICWMIGVAQGAGCMKMLDVDEVPNEGMQNGED